MRGRFLRTAFVLLAVGVVLGLVAGVIWALTAPGVRYQVFANQSWAPLPTETLHRFVSFAIFALLSFALGSCVAVVSWQLSAVRGAASLLMTAGAAVTGALVAGATGSLLVSGTDPADVARTAGVQTVVSAAPELPEWMAFVAAPTAAVICYTFLVAWNGTPDLGRGRI